MHCLEHSTGGAGCILTVPLVKSPPGALVTSQCKNSREEGIAGEGASAYKAGLQHRHSLFHLR